MDHEKRVEEIEEGPVELGKYLVRQIECFYEKRNEEIDVPTTLSCLSTLLIMGMKNLSKNRSDLKNKMNNIINLVLDGLQDE